MQLRTDYLSRHQSNSIKGFFVLWVLVRHFSEYVESAGGLFWDLHFGQLIVAMFLFYSGYGVMCSIRDKGMAYVWKMPVHCCLRTYLNFSVAVAIYALLNLFLGEDLTVRRCLASLLFCDSCGNSTWYIFTIIICYGIAFLSALLSEWKLPVLVPWLALLVSLPVVVGMSFIKPIWWYDTMLCFPVGMIYAQHRKFFERFTSQCYSLSLFICVVVLISLKNSALFARGLAPNLTAIAFTFVLLLVTMKVRMQSGFLSWCGERVFPIYIYQRLPMLTFYAICPSWFSCWQSELVLLFVCLMVTLFVARIFTRFEFRM